jgi:hypothetical protein
MIFRLFRVPQAMSYRVHRLLRITKRFLKFRERFRPISDGSV